MRSPDTHKIAGGIVVRPRFGWDGIGPLLASIGWVASPQVLEMPLVPGSAREIPPWVLAGPVLQRLASLLREIRSGFRMHEEVRQNPRGQIVWKRYVTEQMGRGAFHQLPCRFPELGPDVILRSYLRWGLEKVHRSLIPYAVVDIVARRLAMQAEELIYGVKDSAARVPDKHNLVQLTKAVGLPSQILMRGIQALGWIVDERGLAGSSETDGLAWSMPMHRLFECWVENITRAWAHEFGGQVLAGRADETVVPINWDRGSHTSMKTLIPDLVVRHENHVFVIDAKYKAHFQEMDETRWLALSEEMREEHRHDLHQILAYSSVFDGPEITAVLVYPMHSQTWERLADYDRTVAKATLSSGGRPVNLALVGLPLQIPPDKSIASITQTWNVLRSQVA